MVKDKVRSNNPSSQDDLNKNPDIVPSVSVTKLWVARKKVFVRCGVSASLREQFPAVSLDTVCSNQILTAVH